MLSQAGGDVRVTGQAQGVDRQGAQDGEVGRVVAGAGLAVVLAEDDVADPVQAGLDAPVPAPPAGPQRRVGLSSIEAGDGVDGLHAPAPAPGAPPADDLQRLGGVGKNSPCPSSLPVRSITRMVRVSTRPWPTERTRAASGTWSQGSAVSRVCSVFWLPLIRRIQCAPRQRRSAASSRAVNPASTVITEPASRPRSSRAATSPLAAATSPPVPASGEQAPCPRATPLAWS